jgi:hypothetical protein
MRQVTPVYYDDVEGQEVPPIKWLVEGLIDQGSIGMVFGDTQAMKTWLDISLGLHLAAGKTWLNRFPVKEPLTVVFFDEEMGSRLMKPAADTGRYGCQSSEERTPLRVLLPHRAQDHR